MRRVGLAIIGAGPGGMAAGLTAADLGLEPLVLDDNPSPGGQIYRPRAEGLPGKGLSRVEIQGARLRADFQNHDRIDYLPGATVWGIFENNRIAYSQGGRSLSVGFEQLIIAPGAFDRPVPFPGWTLPGVMTAGAAQRLVKSMGVLPGKKILLAGTGPLQLALAAQLIKAGHRPIAVLEGSRAANPLPILAGLPGNLDLLAELLGYLQTLARARVGIKPGRIVVEARGRDRVEEAVIARVDQDWRPIPGTNRSIAVDTICLGYGLVPSTELTRLAGCDHQYSPELGGSVPIRDRELRTSRPEILAVGDGAGIMGRQVALLEGRLAALAAALRLGRISPGEYRLRAGSLSYQRLRRLKLKAGLDRRITPGPGLLELPAEETIICRCEGVTWGQLRRAGLTGDGTTNELKRATRCGMGRCQGRVCGPFLEAFGFAPFSRRPPLKPIPLGALADSDSEAGHAS